MGFWSGIYLVSHLHLFAYSYQIFPLIVVIPAIVSVVQAFQKHGLSRLDRRERVLRASRRDGVKSFSQSPTPWGEGKSIKQADSLSNSDSKLYEGWAVLVYCIFSNRLVFRVVSMYVWWNRATRTELQMASMASITTWIVCRIHMLSVMYRLSVSPFHSYNQQCR